MIALVFRASCLAAVLCLCAASPALALTGRLSTITYLAESLENRIYVFAISDEGRPCADDEHLCDQHYDGLLWKWQDLGAP